MTREEASKIVVIWGKYVEYIFGKLMVVFGGHIPESLLPFPKNTLSEALNMVAEHHRSIGNNDGVKTIEAVSAFLAAFVDDETALLLAAKNFSDTEWRNALIPGLKKIQDAWIKTQKI
jgi:hypothetical protein